MEQLKSLGVNLNKRSTTAMVEITEFLLKISYHICFSLQKCFNMPVSVN